MIFYVWHFRLARDALGKGCPAAVAPPPLLLANKAFFPLTGVGGVRIMELPSADHLEMQLPRN